MRRDPTTPTTSVLLDTDIVAHWTTLPSLVPWLQILALGVRSLERRQARVEQALAMVAAALQDSHLEGYAAATLGRIEPYAQLVDTASRQRAQHGCLHPEFDLDGVLHDVKRHSGPALALEVEQALRLTMAVNRLVVLLPTPSQPEQARAHARWSLLHGWTLDALLLVVQGRSHPRAPLVDSLVGDLQACAHHLSQGVWHQAQVAQAPHEAEELQSPGRSWPPPGARMRRARSGSPATRRRR